MAAIKLKLFLLVGLVFLTNSISLAQPRSLLLKQQFQSTLDSLRIKYKFPGATAAYILPDGTVETFATGLSDVELNIPMKPQSRMLAASIGKTFVGALVLALEQEGILSLDDLISKWLGQRSWFTRLPNHEKITIRHLLNHTAGIPNHVEMDSFKKMFFSEHHFVEMPFLPERLISFILDQPALFEPGQSWYYSDTGYILVGLIIETATGKSYYEQISQRFLKPLHLSMTTPSDKPILPGLAAGYTSPDTTFGLPAKTTVKPGIMEWNPGIEWTGGGFISNSKDLVLWAKALYTGNAMKEKYLDKLLLSAPISTKNNNDRYGIAVAIREKGPLGRTWGHGGWIPGYCSSLRFYPDSGIAVAFQINTDIGVIDHSTSLIMDMENSLARIVLTKNNK